MKLHRTSHKPVQMPIELVRIGAEEAHYLAEWGASDALQAAARMRPLWCSSDATLTGTSALNAPLGERAAWLCDEYKRLLHGPVEPAWCGQPSALERVRCFSAAYLDLELAFLCVARLWRSVQAGYAGTARQRNAAVEEARGRSWPHCWNCWGCWHSASSWKKRRSLPNNVHSSWTMRPGKRAQQSRPSWPRHYTHNSPTHMCIQTNMHKYTTSLRGAALRPSSACCPLSPCW